MPFVSKPLPGLELFFLCGNVIVDLSSPFELLNWKKVLWFLSVSGAVRSATLLLSLVRLLLNIKYTTDIFLLDFISFYPCLCL